MQLVNMDVDQHGTNQSCHLGPLSPGLNAICGPTGSGKTTLLSWLRQIAAENHSAGYAQPDPVWPVVPRSDLPMRGRVELSNRGSLLHIVHDQHGRIRHETPHAGHADSSAISPNLSAVQRGVFEALAAATGIVDTEAALESLARRLHLDDAPSAHALEQRQRLSAREQDLLEQLKESGQRRAASRDELLARRRELESELQRAATLPSVADATSETRRRSERLSMIEVELQHRQQEIEALDHEIDAVRGELAACDTGRDAGSGVEQASSDISEAFRGQLQQLDDRLNRWRQTLRDLKSQRERLEHNASHARLDKQIGEQLGISHKLDPRAVLRSLEAQILHTRSQLDALVNRYGTEQSGHSQAAAPALPEQDYRVNRDASGRTRITFTDSHCALPDVGQLPETLRAMQHGLHEVCQQLAQHEATAAAETLKQQSQQLQRCEAELLQSVEKLIDERAQLLRAIATEYHLSVEQVTLQVGQWCPSHDRLGLHDWLMQEDAPIPVAQRVDAAARQHLADQLQRLEAQRQRATARCEQCRRQLEENDIARRSTASQLWEARVESNARRHEELGRELDCILAELRAYDVNDPRRQELEQVRQELARLPRNEPSKNRFWTAVDRHILGLVGPRERRDLTSAFAHALRRDDPQDGLVSAQPLRQLEYEVPGALVRVAMRLGIAEAVAAQGDPLPLILDGSLDALSADEQRVAVTYLASRASRGQQIVVLTSDEQIAGLVRTQGGYVGYLRSARTLPAELDINRQLAAYANDHESAKWSQPVKSEAASPPAVSRGECFLNDRSLIEDLPSLDATSAARCRALGIDRVGDLLDVDPHWLAENLRLDGVNSSTVTRWQAEARLLCSVRKLRPFDARVLVGAGIRSPQQLSEMHPSHLLDRVERFLTTDRGRNILRSGSSYELTRITSWIAAAKTGTQRYQRTSSMDDEGFYEVVDSHGDETEYRSRASGDFEGGQRAADPARKTRGSGRTRAGDDRRQLRSQASPRKSERGNGSQGSSQGAAQRSQREYPSLSHTNGEATVEKAERSRQRNKSGARPARAHSSQQPAERHQRTPRTERVRIADTHSIADADREEIFHLELFSPLVEAPSIGPRMSARLEQFGITTVAQLLAANAETLADKLNLRRVDAATIRSWQEQSRLVCRIPNLRAHDAQLLVACDLTSPEELAAMDASSVLSQVLAVAQSDEGQRILRGSMEPDLAEVKRWIAWAGSSRGLHAA